MAEEDRADAELALGRDAALIARLRLLVATYPLRERPWAQLMTALYRTGQRAAALACYRQLREHLVAVTSRSRLPGLGARDGAAQVTLAPFLPDEAAMLLRRVLGAQRTDAEPSAVAVIAAKCAFLPLALRIAAERAIARPRQTLAALAAQLTAARDRLDVLAADDDPATSVRTVFSWSYQALPSARAPRSRRRVCILATGAGHLRRTRRSAGRRATSPPARVGRHKVPPVRSA